MKKIVTRWILICLGIGMVPVLMLGFSPGGIDLSPYIIIFSLTVGLIGASIHSTVFSFRKGTIKQKYSSLILCVIAALFIFWQVNTSNPKQLTPEMEIMARETVMHHLNKNQLPNENLVAVKSQARPTPDFAFLYTGGGRCIEFIVNCYGNDCTELQKYPYDEHGEECP